MSSVTREDSWQSLLPPLLRNAGIEVAGELDVQPIAGGVSSDIVRVRLADGRDVCAKRALTKLKVADDWQVPLERNRYEIAWFRRAAGIVPGSAPKVLAEDEAHGIALLEYLPPDAFVLWKDELLAGRCDAGVATAVAGVIGRIHRATLLDGSVAAEFATDSLFDALRLDPYLRTIARRHPALAEPILKCLATTRDTKVALVHGDLSPKNILIGRTDGHPVILDAECAWYGDPVFDVAFCINHLLLKAVHMRALTNLLISQARQFFDIWVGHFDAGMRDELDRRAAVLLPCLMLARIDGKSPVEYLQETNRQVVRDIAIPLIARPLPTIVATAGFIADRLARTGQGAN